MIKKVLGKDGKVKYVDGDMEIEEAIINTPKEIPKQPQPTQDPVEQKVAKHFKPQQEKPKPMPKEDLKKGIEQWNDTDVAKTNGVRVYKRSTIFLIIFSVVFVCLTLLVLGIWFNVSIAKFADKTFGTTIGGDTVYNNFTIIEEPDINNNNHTIIINNNNTMVFPPEMVDVLKGIGRILNSTNSS